MAKGKRMNHKTLHREVKIEQNAKKQGVNSGVPEGLAVPAPLVTPVVLLNNSCSSSGTCRFTLFLIFVSLKSVHLLIIQRVLEGPGGSMSQVVGLPNNSYTSITNTAWVATGFVNYKKGALDSQPQVIKFTSCLPMVGGSLRALH